MILAIVAAVSAKTPGAWNVKEILGKFQKRLFLITAFLSIINKSAFLFEHPNTHFKGRVFRLKNFDEFIQDKNDRENRYGHFIVLTKKG